MKNKQVGLDANGGNAAIGSSTLSLAPSLPVWCVRKRTPLERFNYIFQRVKENKFPYPNARNMGKELEVSAKVIRRDLESMAAIWALPIEYDHAKHGYYFSTPVERFPGMPLTEEELRSLAVIAKAIEQQRGPAIEPEVKNVYEKCKHLLNGYEQAKVQDMICSTSYRPWGAEPVDESLLALLDEAIRDKREVRFLYRGLEDQEYRVRRVRPYHQTDTNGRWYLVAYDVDAKDERNFVLGRMRDVEKLPDTFTDVFDLKKYFAKRLGIHGGNGDYRIRIELGVKLTKILTGREWQPTQEWTIDPSGVSYLHLHLSSLEEITPLVLSWGRQAKVIEPACLRERVANEAKAIWMLYEG